MKDRLHYINYLRVLAIFLVVGLHCIAPYIVSVPLFDTPVWWFCLVTNAFFRAGVPLFLMISGFLLLRDDTPSVPESVAGRKHLSV
ncbi:MAG: acyltransferase family protein [Oscillospiraceae bacterium]|nr:acyltransferase family protein [Oscillospiraceae bacterium]